MVWFFKKKPNIDKNTQKQNDLFIAQLIEQNHTLRQMVVEIENEKKREEEAIREFLKALLHRKLANVQILGNAPQEMSLMDYIHFARKAVAEMQMEEQTKMMRLLHTIEEQKKEIGSLKEQLSHLLMRERNFMEEPKKEELQKEKEEPVKEPPATPSPKKKEKIPVVTGTVVGDPVGFFPPRNTETKEDLNRSLTGRRNEDVSPNRSLNRAEERKGQGEQITDLHSISLQRVFDRMKDEDWILLFGVAEKGLSLVKDLQDYARDHGLNDATSQRALNRIKTMGLIEAERINIGVKWFWSHSLTELGSRVYLKKTGKNPVLSEREKLIKEHATATHGYGILEVGEIMKMNPEVERVTTDRKVNRIILPSGKEIIPDVIVTFKSKEQLYIEYELAHHTQTDFEDKCDRLAELSPDLVFVTQDQERLTTLKNQIDKWLQKRMETLGDSNPDFSIHLTTLSKLREGIWEYEWPNNQNEEGVGQ